jgi:hypothetical protein
MSRFKPTSMEIVGTRTAGEARLQVFRKHEKLHKTLLRGDICREIELRGSQPGRLGSRNSTDFP